MILIFHLVSVSGSETHRSSGGGQGPEEAELEDYQVTETSSVEKKNPMVQTVFSIINEQSG